MAGTADERIKHFIEKRAAAEKQVKDAAAQREGEIARATAKSRDAFNLIEGVLKELESKLAPASPLFRTKEPGVHPGYIATLNIIGRLAGKSVDAAIHVRPDGTITAASAGPTYAQGKVQFGNERHLSVFTASKDQYEELLLDLLGID
jgi:hypothetical protein